MTAKRFAAASPWRRAAAPSPADVAARRTSFEEALPLSRAIAPRAESSP